MSFEIEIGDLTEAFVSHNFWFYLIRNYKYVKRHYPESTPEKTLSSERIAKLCAFIHYCERLLDQGGNNTPLAVITEEIRDETLELSIQHIFKPDLRYDIRLCRHFPNSAAIVSIEVVRAYP